MTSNYRNHSKNIAKYITETIYILLFQKNNKNERNLISRYSKNKLILGEKLDLKVLKML